MQNVSVIISFDKAQGKFKCAINGQKFTTTKQQYIEYMYKQITGQKATFKEIEAMQKPATAEKFGINQRFGFVEKIVGMVATGVQPSTVITGQGGLGKTYTVMKTLKANGLEDFTEVVAKLPVGATIHIDRKSTRLNSSHT